MSDIECTKKKIVDALKEKSCEIFDSCTKDKRERGLVHCLAKILREEEKKEKEHALGKGPVTRKLEEEEKEKERNSYKGLFGWDDFRTDGSINICNQKVILEVKKVVPNQEYGYWHAVSQGLIYAFCERLKKSQDKTQSADWLVLCIILDWGRKGKNKLFKKEKGFLDQFKCRNIFFVRINMQGKRIEHNLLGDWQEIDP